MSVASTLPPGPTWSASQAATVSTPGAEFEAPPAGPHAGARQVPDGQGVERHLQRIEASGGLLALVREQILRLTHRRTLRLLR